MFRRALKAVAGSRRPGPEMVGGRWVLVPPSTDYPPKRTRPGASRSGAQRRQSAAERRRTNLTYLAGFIVVTFVLGLIPPLRPLLYVNLVADVLLIAYLGAAVYYAARTSMPQAPRPEPTRESLYETTDLPQPGVAGGGL